MATNDMLTELNRDTFKLDEDSERKLVHGMYRSKTFLFLYTVKIYRYCIPYKVFIFINNLYQSRISEAKMTKISGSVFFGPLFYEREKYLPFFV